MSKIDFNKYRLAETGTLEIQDAKGNLIEIGDKPLTFEFHSPASSKYVYAKYKLDNANNARNIAVFQGKATKDNAEAQAKDDAEFLAAVTKSLGDWSEFPDGALGLFSDNGYVHIKNQVLKYLGDYANF
jgi:hypothetical protein